MNFFLKLALFANSLFFMSSAAFAQPVEVCTAIGIPDSNIILAALTSDLVKNDSNASGNIKSIDLQRVSGCHTYLVTLKNSADKQTSLEVKFINSTFSYEVKKQVAQNPRTLSEVYSAIDQLNQDLKCNADSDCTSVALGKRACGGPSRYIVSSLLNGELGRIRSLAQRSVVLEDEENRTSGGFSICSFEMAPDVKCKQQQCSK